MYWQAGWQSVIRGHALPARHVFYHLHVGDTCILPQTWITFHATLPGTSSVWPDFWVFLGLHHTPSKNRETPQRSCSKRIIISCNLCDNIKICQLHCTSTCTINVTSTKILVNRLICSWHFQWFLSLKVSDFTCECTHHLGRWWMMPTSINQLWMGWIRLLLQNVQCHMGMTDVQNRAHRHVWTTHLRQQCGGPCREMWSRWPFIGPWGINRKCSWDFYWIYADRAAVVWFWFVNIGASLWMRGLDVSNCLGFISRPQLLDSITCPVWGLGRLQQRNQAGMREVSLSTIRSLQCTKIFPRFSCASHLSLQSITREYKQQAGRGNMYDVK